jgi:hypothetical protein
MFLGKICFIFILCACVCAARAKKALNLAKDKAREALLKLSATLKGKLVSLKESPESM